MDSRRKRVAGALSVMAGGGLLCLGAPAMTATAAQPTATHLAAAKRAPFRLTEAGRAHVDAASASPTATGNPGAVTFVDDALSDATFSVNLGSTTIGGAQLEAGDVTYPQILPPGTYTLSVTVGTSTVPAATSTFTVTSNQDRSEAYYNTSDGPTGAIQDTLDAVSTVPTGASVLSFRNESGAGPVDVYVDTTKELSDVAEGGSADATVPVGFDTVSLDKTGTTTPVDAGAEPETILTAAPDAYQTVYLINGTGGSAYLLNLNTFIQGYAFTAADGGTFNYGSLPFQGSVAELPLAKPVVGGAANVAGPGDYLVASDGGVFANNGAPFLGSTGNIGLAKPVVGMVATDDGTNGAGGYLLVASDGGVFAYNTPFYGSLGNTTIPAPVVGISDDPTTGAYDMALANGEVVDFSSEGQVVIAPPAANLTSPIVGIADTPDGEGFWLVGADGGVFAEGDATYYGSEGGQVLNQPVTGIQPTYDGLGYDLIAKDGGIFSFGNAKFFGSTGNINLVKPAVGPIAIP